MRLSFAEKQEQAEAENATLRQERDEVREQVKLLLHRIDTEGTLP